MNKVEIIITTPDQALQDFADTWRKGEAEQGNPEIKTLSAILKAMGMRLAVQPIQHSQTCT